MIFLLNATILSSVTVALIILIKLIMNKNMLPKWHLFIWAVLLVQLLSMPAADYIPSTAVSMKNLVPSFEKTRSIQVGRNDNSNLKYGKAATLENQANVGNAAANTENVNNTFNTSNTVATANVGNTGNTGNSGNAVNSADAGEITATAYNEINSDASDRINNQPPAATNIHSDNNGQINFDTGKGKPSDFGGLLNGDLLNNTLLNKIVIIVWAAGALIFTAYQLFSYRTAQKSVKKLPAVEDSRRKCLLDNMLTTFDCSAKQVAFKGGSEVTMLIGLFHPVICIEDRFSNEELEFVAAHELSHLKHRDILLNIIGTAVLALFWFNPLIWYAYHLFKRDIEIYCDDRVSGIMGRKKEYAKVLAKSAACQMRLIPGTTAFLRGEKEVIHRVRRLAAGKNMSRISKALAILLICAITISCTSNGVNAGSGDRSKGDNDIAAITIHEGTYQMAVPYKWLDNTEVTKSSSDSGDVSASDTTVSASSGTDAEAATGLDADMATTGSISNWTEEIRSFSDAGGNVFSELIFSSEMLADLELEKYYIVTPRGGSITDEEYPSEEEIMTRIYKYLENDKGFSEVAETSRNASSDGGFLEVSSEFTAKKGDKEYVGAIHQQYVYAVIFYAEKDRSSAEMMTRCIETFGYAEPLFNIQNNMIKFAYATDDEDFNNEISSSITPAELKQYYFDKYAPMALSQYCDIFMGDDIPLEARIKEYKVENIEMAEPTRILPKYPKTVAGAFCDEVRWDIIYPDAFIAKADIKKVPYDERFYNAATEETVYGVFMKNTYIKEENAANIYFEGIVPKQRIEDCGFDLAVLDALNNTYYATGAGFSKYYTDYIGNAQEVGRIVSSMPLKEYIDVRDGAFSDRSISIQTSKEPYGLTINYRFPEALIPADVEPGKPWYETPVEDRIMMTPVSDDERYILKSGVNAYIMERLVTNARCLFTDIGNLGDLTINVWCKRGEAGEETLAFTLHQTREGYDDGIWSID